MNLTKIVGTVLFVLSIALFYYLYSSIDSTIKFKESISTTEAQVIEKLSLIREAEKVYLEQHGKYTSSWDTLINFIETAQVPIIQRREIITQESYGVDKVEVLFDTLGSISAKEKIFKKNYTVNAADNGVFQGYGDGVKVGDYVVKGAKSYRLKKDGSERTDEYSFLEKGTVHSMARFNVGDHVKKGQILINFWDYQFNPEIDVKTLNLVPGSDNKSFDIFTEVIDRNGIKVSVIEVKDPAPINPDRNERNEAKNRKPLRFGSRTDVNTSGNWE
ncbi:MAG: hypothetical protein L0Y35_05675 [Flammeovirgaceae bacterium]|nr:hypothetical protein [Flammeovirgaceae bacterium]